jgi:glycosyltransferase involved in cell wall biosynthesis
VRASGAPNVDLHLEYVDEASMARFFARADLVVLPYRTETPSAVAALAYHFDRPILATRVNGLKDVVEEGHTGWLIDPDSPEQLAGRLRSLTRPQLQQMRPAVRDYKSRFNWQTLAAMVLRLAGEIGHA